MYIIVTTICKENSSSIFLEEVGIFSSDEPLVVQCRQFEQCIIPCRGKPDCTPDSQCRVDWKIGNDIQQNVQFTKRVGIDNNGDLYFSWTNSSDWTGLDYRCEVWQEQLNMLVVGNPIRLNILDAKQSQEMEPVILITANSTVKLGEEGVLRCMFSGYPTADIEWIKHKDECINTTTSKFILSDYNRILRIKDVIPDDEGIYICKGIWNNKTFLNPIYLNVTSPPVLDSSSENPQMKDILAIVGENARFYCDVVHEEQPPTFPTWMKDGKGLQIHLNREKYTLKDNNKVLTVFNVHNTDSGVYQCLSENSEGVMLKEAILKVIEKPAKPFITGDLEPNVNTYSIFTCSSRQNSVYDTYAEVFASLYMWYVNDTLLKNITSKIYRFMVQKALKYNRYSCQILSSDRSDQVQANPFYGPSKEDLKISPIRDKITICDGNTIGPYTCAVDCNPPCSVQWKYTKWNGQQVNATHLGYNSVTLLKRQIDREEVTELKCVTKGREEKEEALVLNMEIQHLSEPRIYINGFLKRNVSDIQESTPLQMSCHVDGNTIPTVTIFRGEGNKILGKRDDHWFNHTFEKVNCFDTNIYICKGRSNLCSTEETKVSVNVLCKPRLDSQTKFNYLYQAVDVPTFVSIKIPIIANPKPKLLKWHGVYPNPGIVSTVTQTNQVFRHWVSSTIPIYNKSFLGNYTLYGDEFEITTIHLKGQSTFSSSVAKFDVWIIVGPLVGVLVFLMATIFVYKRHSHKMITLSSIRSPGVATVKKEYQDINIEEKEELEEQSNEYEGIANSDVVNSEVISTRQTTEFQNLTCSRDQDDQYEDFNI
ncbi:hemicentin-1-like [Saccostrea cucullata]|uniref:hemicentin-1-like n=1 Tax=Saccostrea cuccullata TaxID=36930 RepID=UPI002ED0206C